MDEGGVPTQIYLWTADGWVNDSFEPAVATLTPGEGVLINTYNADVNVQFSGEVGAEDMQLVSVAGFNFVGNASPIVIDVQAITLTGEDVFEYVDSIQILDEGGVPTQIFLWTAAGWVNDSFEPVAVNLNPGDGVLINTYNAGVEINLPAVEL